MEKRRETVIRQEPVPLSYANNIPICFPLPLPAERDVCLCMSHRYVIPFYSFSNGWKTCALLFTYTLLTRIPSVSWVTSAVLRSPT